MAGEKIVCPEFTGCVDRRVADAEFKGKVESKLESIGKAITDGFAATWSAIEISRGDIKQIYLRVGMIAGGVSLLISLSIFAMSHFIK